VRRVYAMMYVFAKTRYPHTPLTRSIGRFYGIVAEVVREWQPSKRAMNRLRHAINGNTSRGGDGNNRAIRNQETKRGRGKKNMSGRDRHIASIAKREANRAVNADEELKIFDVFTNTQNIGTGGTLANQTLIPQGVGNSQRVSDEVYLRRLLFTWQVVQLNTDIYGDVRIILFQWHPNTAIATPTLASILQNTTGNGLWTAYNWQERDQYTVIYDEVVSAAGLATAPTASSNQRALNIRLTPPRRKMVFALASTAASNSVWLLQVSDSAIAPFPVMTYNLRIEYVDA